MSSVVRVSEADFLALELLDGKDRKWLTSDERFVLQELRRQGVRVELDRDQHIKVDWTTIEN